MKCGQTRKGFTIVELLIVVIVIAILATITIVGFNAVQNRARESAAQAAASQAARKIMAYAALNSDQFPSTLAEAGVNNSDGALQYTGGGSNFCVTSTVQNVSYFQRIAGQVAKGACDGHDRDGVAAITNLIINPSFEANNASDGSNIGASAGATSLQTVGAQYGSRYFRMIMQTGFNSVGRGQMSDVLPVGRYTGSFWVRSNKAVNFSTFYEGTSAKTTVTSTPAANVALSPDTWTRLSRVFDITTAGTVKVGGYCPSCNGLVANQDYVDMDAFMLVSGDQLSGYADGSSPGWVWNGNANASTSRGPAL